MLQAHYHKTINRAKETKTDYILAIQDKTTLNFTTHHAKTELGRIGGKVIVGLKPLKKGESALASLIAH